MKHGHANPGELGGIFLNLIILLCFVIFCALLYLVRRPILRYTAESWIIEDPLDRADAVMVLGDDNFYADRATRGAELFRVGKASVMVASGRRLRPNAGIAELMEHDLVERGVPRDKIVRFAHDADSTHPGGSAGTCATRKREKMAQRNRSDIEFSHATHALYIPASFSAGFGRAYCERAGRRL